MRKKKDSSTVGERDSPESSVEKDSIKAEQKRILLAPIIKLVALCLTIWILFTFIFGVAQMKGETMYPSIRDGDLMLYYRLQNNYFTDDVVTFVNGKYRYVARIIAMEGDIVDINDDGQLLVNGNIQDGDFETTVLLAGVSYPYTVGEDCYFVLCDYRTSSIDSRRYGEISKKDLDGKIITILRRRGI